MTEPKPKSSLEVTLDEIKNAVVEAENGAFDGIILVARNDRMTDDTVATTYHSLYSLKSDPSVFVRLYSTVAANLLSRQTKLIEKQIEKDTLYNNELQRLIAQKIPTKIALKPVKATPVAVKTTPEADASTTDEDTL
jgi:hypothetical protein